MKRLIESYKKSGGLHHAYFLVGNTEEILIKLKEFLEKDVGMKIMGSADFWHGKYNTLNIDSAREIASAQERKDFLGGRKVFVIQADIITEEAQNSLLKVFEEPTTGTHFFIISPQDVLLPTLRSRMVVIRVESYKVIKLSSTLELALAERLLKVKEITEAISEAKTSSSNSFARSDKVEFREEKTKQDAISLLNQIELELHKKGVEKSAKSLEICESARASLYDRGAPIKMILENVMLSI